MTMTEPDRPEPHSFGVASRARGAFQQPLAQIARLWCAADKRARTPQMSRRQRLDAGLPTDGGMPQIDEIARILAADRR